MATATCVLNSKDRVLLVRSACIGDLIVCIPFVEHLVNVVGIARENLGFLILNSNSSVQNPVKMLFGEGYFPEENMINIKSTSREVLKAMPALRRLASRFDKICFLPFQGDSSSSIMKKRIMLALMCGPFRSVLGLDHFQGPGIRRSQYLGLLDLYGIGYRKGDYLSFLRLKDEEKMGVLQILEETPSPCRIALYPNSKLALKIWPKERYLEILRWLLKDYAATIYLIGAKEDHAYNEEIIADLQDNKIVNVAGMFSIRQTVSLLSKMSLLIGNDGAPLHMAALADVPILGLYTYKEPLGVWAPVGSPRHITLQGDVPCRECYRVECGDPICLRMLTIDQVKEAITAILSGCAEYGAYLMQLGKPFARCEPKVSFLPD